MKRRRETVEESWEKLRKIFLDLCAKLCHPYSFSCICSRIRSLKSRQTITLLFLMYPRNPTHSVTHCTTGLRFWSSKTDWFCQRHLKSFLDSTEKRPFSRRLSRVTDCVDVHCVQNPVIHAPRSNSVVALRSIGSAGRNITRILHTS